jgi:hypothetical protein
MLIKKEPAIISKRILLAFSLMILVLFFAWLPRFLPKKEPSEVWTGPKHTLPIIAITTPPENLWDPEIGIYVKGNHDNFLQEGEAWERPAQLKFYEADGHLAFEYKIGLRIHGKNLRAMPQKAFRVYLKDSQNREASLDYPLFGPTGLQQFTSFALRVGDGQYTMLRTHLASELVAQNSNLDVQRSRPVIVYLNGEYWGLYYLQERFDDTYFSAKYRLGPKLVGVVETILRSGEDKGQAVPDRQNSVADAERYNQLLQAVRHCRQCETYDSISKSIDVDNLIDYLLFELYFDNLDWPYNNTKAWRCRVEPLPPKLLGLAGVLDGRFRWLFFDLDVGFGAATSPEQEMIKAAGKDPYERLIDPAFPFGNLFYDSVFQKHYVARMNELIEGGLNSDKAVEEIDRLAAEIRPEMPQEIERWGKETAEDGSHVVSSLEEWESRVALLKVFVQQRPEQFLQHTLNLFYKVGT